MSYPHGCGEAVPPLEIVVPECESEPPCPKVNNFTFLMGPCVIGAGGACCRLITFTYDINIKMGCGSALKPKIKINFGDGSFDEHEFSTGGQFQESFTHIYCGGGTYTVTLETLYPAACFDQTLSVSVPDCAPADCGLTDDGGDDNGRPCPCCILVLIVVLAYYLLWALGFYQGDLVVFSVILGSVFGFGASIFSFLILMLMIFCYKRVASCKKCWWCRFYKCMFLALIAAIIAITVIALIMLFAGNMPGFWIAVQAL
jgi:hypothetical protein